MCGIAGFVGLSDPELLRRMTRTLTHRGPDGEGFREFPQASLGHRRLAIIDLEGGAQPMPSADDTVWVSFNGQIYNYLDIRRDLTDYPFATHCDTEVLPVLYQRFGAEMVHRLRGMFAFAVWDAAGETLLLARDRVGVKPLYYAQVGKRLFFASEPKSLLLCPGVSREIDATALDAYLSLLYVPPPYSIFQGIRQLPPGCTLTWRAGEVRIDRYWDWSPQPDGSRSDEEWAETLAPVLEESIRMRMMSDVPLGAFLSGGIDSSTIVSVLAAHSNRPVETFCIGFGDEGKAYEERPIARRVSDYFGTNHHEMQVEIDAAAGLEELVEGFDEPFGNPTAMLTSALAKFTREFVTVSLAGDGGDELFGGYPRYQGLVWSELLARFPRWSRNLAVRLVGGGESSTARNYKRWARELLEGCNLAPPDRYAAWVGYRSEGQRDQLLAPPVRESVSRVGRVSPVVDLFQTPKSGGAVERAVYADLHGFLPENVLRYSDRMSMAHSLEVRVPFTDHVLWETASRIPASRHVSALASKRLMRKIMKGKLPDEIVERKKLGFNPPMGIWLQSDKLGLINQWLSPDRLARAGIFDPGEVARIVAEHRSKRRDHGLRLWSLIVFEAWRERFLG